MNQDQEYLQEQVPANEPPPAPAPDPPETKAITSCTFVNRPTKIALILTLISLIFSFYGLIPLAGIGFAFYGLYKTTENQIRGQRLAALALAVGVVSFLYSFMLLAQSLWFSAP